MMLLLTENTFFGKGIFFYKNSLTFALALFL